MVRLIQQNLNQSSTTYTVPTGKMLVILSGTNPLTMAAHIKVESTAVYRNPSFVTANYSIANCLGYSNCEISIPLRIKPDSKVYRSGTNPIAITGYLIDYP